MFHVLNKLKCPVAGDIGCYTLGLLPPLSALHTCGCMGASIGVAHGAARPASAKGWWPSSATRPFSTPACRRCSTWPTTKSDVVTIILDNRITAMTGHQQNPGTGYTLQMQEMPPLELEPLVRALGIERVKTVPAFDVKAMDETLKDCLKAEGPSVLIARDECALLPSARKRWLPLAVDRRKVQRLHHVLPGRLPGDSQERRAGREDTAAQGPDRPPAVHRLRGVRPGLPAEGNPVPRPGGDSDEGLGESERFNDMTKNYNFFAGRRRRPGHAPGQQRAGRGGPGSGI